MSFVLIRWAGGGTHSHRIIAFHPGMGLVAFPLASLGFDSCWYSKPLPDTSS
jgi:hypothetical protein